MVTMFDVAFHQTARELVANLGNPRCTMRVANLGNPDLIWVSQIPRQPGNYSLCRFINRRQCGPMDHFRFWKESLHLASDDHGVAYYEAIMRMLEMLACWDCVDVPNLAGIELAMRRAQMYEYLYVMESTDPGPAPGVEPPRRG